MAEEAGAPIFAFADMIKKTQTAITTNNEAQAGAATVDAAIGAANLAVTALGAVGGGGGKGGGGGRSNKLGDLSASEVKEIQNVVETAGRPLEVVGSAASGTRRGVGIHLPIGKGPGAQSDIDYLAPPSSHPYFHGMEGRLPSLDPGTGLIPGTHNPHIGPGIRFDRALSRGSFRRRGKPNASQVLVRI